MCTRTRIFKSKRLFQVITQKMTGIQGTFMTRKTNLVYPAREREEVQWLPLHQNLDEMIPFHSHHHHHHHHGVFLYLCPCLCGNPDLDLCHDLCLGPYHGPYHDPCHDPGHDLCHDLCLGHGLCTLKIKKLYIKYYRYYEFVHEHARSLGKSESVRQKFT